MAQLKNTNFNADQKKGLGVNSPLIVDGGADGSFAVLANQINWGNGSQILGKTIATTAGTTEQLFSAIEKGVDAKIASGALNKDAVDKAISDYLAEEGVFPSLQVVTEAQDYTTYYISGVSVDGHKISLQYNELPQTLTTSDIEQIIGSMSAGSIPHPSINIDSNSELENDITYYISGFSVSGHTIQPHYSKLPESVNAEYVQQTINTSMTPSSFWGVY